MVEKGFKVQDTGSHEVSVIDVDAQSCTRTCSDMHLFNYDSKAYLMCLSVMSLRRSSLVITTKLYWGGK